MTPKIAKLTTGIEVSRELLTNEVKSEMDKAAREAGLTEMLFTPDRVRTFIVDDEVERPLKITQLYSVYLKFVDADGLKDQWSWSRGWGI